MFVELGRPGETDFDRRASIAAAAASEAKQLEILEYTVPPQLTFDEDFSFNTRSSCFSL